MRALKYSGVEWIGNIPAEWEMKRLKAIFLERKEKNDPQQTDFILSLGAAYGVVPYSEKEGGGNKAKEDLTAYRLAYPDDIVMNSMNIISGSVGISKYFGCVSPVYYMLYPRLEGVNQHYYCRMFQTKAFQRSLLGLGNGILMKETESGNFNTVRMRIPMEKLGVQLLPFPSAEEQKRIADFLDRKCAEIDTVIEKTKATIEEYKKLKQSVITEAVTKGIRGDRAMKDSGVEWIGNIPAEMEIIKIKYITDISRGLFNHRPRNDERYYGGDYPFIQTGDVARAGKYITTYSQTLNELGCSVSKEFPKGTMTMTIAANIGDVAILGFNAYFPDSVVGFTPKKDFFEDYIYYLFLSMKEMFIRTAVVSTQLNLNLDRIKELFVPITRDMNEQKEIANFLDRKCSEIDKLIADKTHLLEEMESYKKSVIYEYVTGKKEVKNH